MATNNQHWRMSDGDGDEDWKRDQLYLRAEDADEQAAMRASGYLDDLDDEDERDENEFGGDLEDEDELDDDETEIEDLDEFRDPVTIPVSNPELPALTAASPIRDERCDCGHLRSQHGDTIAKGHGACTAALGVMEYFDTGIVCPCRKFTWVAFVDDATDAQDELIGKTVKSTKANRKSKSSRKSKPKPKPASVRVSKSGVRRPASKKKKH